MKLRLIALALATLPAATAFAQDDAAAAKAQWRKVADQL